MKYIKHFENYSSENNVTEEENREYIISVYKPRDGEYYISCDNSVEDTAFAKHRGIYLTRSLLDKNIVKFKSLQDAKQYLKEADRNWRKTYKLIEY